MANSINTNLIPHFNGEWDSKLWIVPFQLIVSAKGLNGTKARTKLPLYFKDSSLKWYISLGDYHALKDVFLRRFEHLIEEQSGTKQSYVEVYIVKTTTFFRNTHLI
jgi:hypothetical protein